jgi:hypothetical protein
MQSDEETQRSVLGKQGPELRQDYRAGCGRMT